MRVSRNSRSWKDEVRIMVYESKLPGSNGSKTYEAATAEYDTRDRSDGFVTMKTGTPTPTYIGALRNLLEATFGDSKFEGFAEKTAPAPQSNRANKPQEQYHAPYPRIEI